MSPVMQELPQALIAFVPVLSWRTDSALAERTPMSMVANKIFFTMDGPLSSIQFVDPGGGGPSGWQKPPVPKGL